VLEEAGDSSSTRTVAAVIRHYVGVTKKCEVAPDLVLRLRGKLPQERRERARDTHLGSG